MKPLAKSRSFSNDKKLSKLGGVRPTQEPYQIQPSNLFQVKLIPDNTTDQLRMQANRLRQSDSNIQANEDAKSVQKKADNSIVYIDIPSTQIAKNSKEQSEKNSSTNTSKNKIASGFVRSNRNIQMMDQKESPEYQIQVLKDEKDLLIKRLNDSLINLDKLNEEKRKMHDQLLEQIKFVRDLNVATGGTGLDDLNSLVSQEVKSSLNQEQALHKHLEAQLLRADQERSQLFDRIKHLSSDKQWVTVSNQGQQNTFKATNQTLLQLQKQIRDLNFEINQQQREIDRLRIFVRQDSDPDFLAKERQIAVINNEKELLLRKTNEMMNRENQAVASLSNEQRRLYQINKQQLKLICAKSFSNVLKKLVSKSQQLALEQIWRVNNELQMQNRKVQSLHSIFNQMRKTLIKESLQTWYARTYEPNQTSNMNKNLPMFYQRKDYLKLNQNKVKIASDSNKVDNLRIAAGTKIISFISCQWEFRVKKSAFQFWKKNLFPKLQATQQISRNCNKFNIFRKQQAYDKWKDLILFQNSVAKFHALPIKLAAKSIQQRVFQSWRQFSLSKILQKRGRLLRAFKNLQVATQRTQLLQKLKILAQKANKEYRQTLLQACWSEIVLQNQQEVLEQSKEQLLIIDPNILQLKSDNNNLKKIKDKKELIRSVHALVITPFSKQLTQWFLRWKQNARKTSTQYFEDMKILMLKLYKNKLRVAFNRWKICEADKQRKFNHKKIDSLHDQIIQNQSDNFNRGRIVADEKDRIQQLAFKHLKRMCEQAFKGNLSYWLQRWQQGCFIKKARENQINFLIGKIRKCLLKQAFKIYQRGCNLQKQDQQNLKRIEEVTQRLKFREKKRVYKALRNFALNHIYCTKTLKALIRMTDKHQMVRGLLQWQRYTRQMREKQLFLVEQTNVLKIDELQKDSGNIQDDLNRKQINNDKLKSIYKLEVKVTLQKWIERFCMGGLQYGFITWKQKTAHLKHRILYVQSVRRHQVLKQLRLAWHSWQQASVNLYIGNNLQYIERLETQTEIEKLKISHNFQQHQIVKERLQTEVVPFKNQTELLNQRAQKVQELMISRKNKNFTPFKLRFILQKWHQHSKSYKKCGKALEKGITNLMLQRGFYQIRDTTYSQVTFERRVASGKRLVKLYKKLRLRKFFNNWRDRSYNQELQSQFEIQKQTKILVSDQNEFVSDTKLHHSCLINNRFFAKKMQDIYNFLHQYAFNKAIKRRQQINLQEKIDLYLKHRALLKFNRVVKQTFKQKAQLDKFKQKLRQIYQSAVYSALKYQYKVDKTMSCKTVAVCNALQKFHQRIAFIKIQKYSSQRHESSQRCKEQSCRNLGKVFDRLKTQRLRHAQANLLLNAKQFNRRRAILQQYLVIGRAIDYRQFFFRWKNNAAKQNVVDFNENEDGIVNVECWNLRLKCNALASLMQHDGAPDEDIENVIIYSKYQFNHLADKTITRMMINGDKNLRLLPLCLNRLKSHAKVKKYWRQKLHFCNQLLQTAENQLLIRFRRWRDFDCKQRKVLSKIHYQNLIHRSDQNKIKLLRLAESVDLHVEGLQKFKEQRDTLFYSYIGSQKLGLSVLKNTFEQNQQAAISNITDFGNKNLQSQIGQSIKRNLQIIDDLKAQISIIEDENQEIAQRNDYHRGEALHAARNRQYLKSIQQENFNLINQQAENAAMIRRLMEENFTRQKQLQSFTMEAKQILEKTSRLREVKLLEIEKLRNLERESALKRAQMASTSIQNSHSFTQDQPQQRTQGSFQGLREHQNRSLSPPTILSPTNQNLRNQQSINIPSRSPLRVRSLSGGRTSNTQQ